MTMALHGKGFSFNYKKQFLLAASYYGGASASEATIQSDLAQLADLGFNHVRVFATWCCDRTATEDCIACLDSDEESVVRSDGGLNPTPLARLEFLIETAERLRMSVDVTFDYGLEGLTKDFDLYRLAIDRVTSELRPYRFIFFDLANEHDGRNKLSPSQICELVRTVKSRDPERIVTASGGYGKLSDPEASATYLDQLRWCEASDGSDGHAGIDFFAPHLPRTPGWGGRTESIVTELYERLEALGGRTTIYLQEEARRHYNDAAWPKREFLAGLEGAWKAKAAGWCFHTRAGFDLNNPKYPGGFFGQLDQVERDTIDELALKVRMASGDRRSDDPPPPPGGCRR